MALHQIGTNPTTKTQARFAIRDMERQAKTYDASTAARTTFDGASQRAAENAADHWAEAKRLRDMMDALPEFILPTFHRIMVAGARMAKGTPDEARIAAYVAKRACR